MKKNHQWIRVTGDDLHPVDKVREEQNKSTMNSPEFKRACELADTPVTKRQASKFRKKRGLAYARR